MTRSARPLFLATLALGFVLSGVRAQQDPMVTAILTEGLQRSKVMDHLDHLVNRIGPRLTGSDRLTIAGEWAVEQLKSWGFDARLEKWGEFPVGFNRGPWFGRMVEPVETALTFATDAWTAGTKGRVRGEAVLAPTNEVELAAREQELAGKWVLEPAGFRGRFRKAPRNPAAPGEPEAEPERGDAKLLDAAYARAGILGIVRSTGEELVRTAGNWKISFDALPTRVEINMVKSSFAAIEKALAEHGKALLEFDIRNHFRRGPIPLYNVVADLKGTEKPDEYVIVGGHLDSWDGATGTTDNGTGASSTLEAARILAAAGVKPRRTIRIMLWSGEEQGLLGSIAWCRENQAMLDRISGVFVHDGGTNFVSGVTGTTAHEEDFKRIFAPVMKLDPEKPFEVRAAENGLSAGGGSDHASFVAQGVPGFYWSQSGRANYGYGWHTQHDTYDLAIPDYQRHTATIVAIAAYGVASLDHLLSRENLKSSRDTTRTGRMLGVDLDESLTVTEVTPDSAAAKAGVRIGDRLVELDGFKLADRFELRRAANQGEAKKALVVQRGKDRVTLAVEWAK